MNLTIPINFHKTDFAQLSLIGQFNKGFIIAKKNNSLFIIDQHAADEKYLFETFQEVTEIHKQPLIIPKQLKLTSDEEVLLYNNLESFSANGFSFCYDENASVGNKFSISSFPISKKTVFDVGDFEEMMENLKKIGFCDQFQTSKLIRPKKFRDMFASRACRKAVMIGTALEGRKMNEIMNNLGTLEHPWNCPHGRPTIRLLKSIPNMNSSLPKPNFKNLKNFL